MKKNIVITILIMGLFIFAPIKTNAAGISLELEGEKTNSATFSILYDSTDAVTGDFNFTASIDTADVTMNDPLIKDGIDGKCTGNSCALTNVTTTGSIGTITLVNKEAVDKEVELKIGGTYQTSIKITLKAGATTTTTAKKNSDSNLSGINLSVGTIDPVFNATQTAYTITGIKDTVNSINVTPTCTNNCNWSLTCPNGECSISNSKKVTLETGANTVNVNVISEDTTTSKIYVLTIYRGEIKTSSAYLSSLKITGAKLSPAFDSLTNDYTTTIDLSVEKLDINAISEDPDANIEIKGNEALKEGENTITITVTSSDQANKQVYSILVTKEKKEEEKVTTKKITTKKVEKKTNNTLLIIILSVLGLGLIIVVGIILFKKKKNKKDKNNKNNTPKGGTPEKELETKSITGDLLDELGIEEEEKVSEQKQNYLDEEDPKTDVDDALDDLMKTKKIELGDLNF